MIELLAAGAPPPPPPSPAKPVPTDPPVLELPPAGGAGVRTIVIDPGHGGADVGVTGPGGTREKEYVLDLARRLKTAVESRLGLRVLLTRDDDELVPFDRRTSLANNNKADLFISLHANASRHSDTTGAQVLTLNADLYQGRLEAARAPELPVPVGHGREPRNRHRALGRRADAVGRGLLAGRRRARASAHRTQGAALRASRRHDCRCARWSARTCRPCWSKSGFCRARAMSARSRATNCPAAIVEAIVDTVSEVRRDGSAASSANGQ